MLQRVSVLMGLFIWRFSQKGLIFFLLRKVLECCEVKEQDVKSSLNTGLENQICQREKQNPIRCFLMDKDKCRAMVKF